MMGRAIGSIIWASLTGGTKILAKMYMSIRRGRGIVKKGSKAFYSSLIEYGLPHDFAHEITVSYASPGMEMLKLRNIIRMVQELSDE